MATETKFQALAGRMRDWPAGIWVMTLAVCLVGGRYLWIWEQRPAHEHELAKAYGTVRSFSGIPQSDKTGKHITFVETADVGFGVFLCDTATGQKRNVRVPGADSNEEYPNFRVWPWSPDDGSFLYSGNQHAFICDSQSGSNTASIDLPTRVTAMTWLNQAAIMCLGTESKLYQLNCKPDGKWTSKEVAIGEFALHSFKDAVAVVASQADAGEDADNAVDGDQTTSWFSGKTTHPVWLQYQFNGLAWAIARYTLTSSSADADADPHDWELLGSNDGTNWTVLDTRVNETFTARGQTKHYDFANKIPYWFYRLNVTATAGGAGSGVRLAEFQLYSRDTPAVASASTENLPAEGAWVAFDGSVNTKWFNYYMAPPAWLQYEFGGGEARALSQYALTSGNDVPERDPTDWQFQASNDGVTWTNLDARGGESFNSRQQTKSYSFQNSTPYRFYRLYITANHGAPLDGVQLSELDLGLRGLLAKIGKPDDGLNPLTDAFSLTTLDNRTIAWGQSKWIWSLNMDSNSPQPLLDLQTAMPTNTLLRSLSYSREAKQFLLSCNTCGKDSLWRFDPNSPSNLVQVADMALCGIWINGGNDGGAWVVRQTNCLLVQRDPASAPVQIIPGANIDGMTISPDGHQLFLLGTTNDEPLAGIWQYEFASAQLKCVAPYGNQLSAYAKRENYSGASLRLASGEAVTYYIFPPVNGYKYTHRKYPLVIGDTPLWSIIGGAHGRLWIQAVSAGDAYVVIVDRPVWVHGIENWSDNVEAVYNEVVKTLPIDKSRVFLYGASAETSYMNDLITRSPGLWRGAILLNPSGLPEFPNFSPFEQRPKILISAGGLEEEDEQFKSYQVKALQSGALVEYFISPGEGHHFVGNVGQLQRTEAIMHLVFDE